MAKGEDKTVKINDLPYEDQIINLVDYEPDAKNNKNPNIGLFTHMTSIINEEFKNFGDEKLIPVFSVMLSYFVGIKEQNAYHDLTLRGTEYTGGIG